VGRTQRLNLGPEGPYALAQLVEVSGQPLDESLDALGRIRESWAEISEPGVISGSLDMRPR
jgi:gluconokinase